MGIEQGRRAAVKAWHWRLLGALGLAICAAGTQASPGLMASATVAAAATPAPGVELTPYPRAKQVGRYDNPLEVGALPISPPQRDAKGNRTSRWRLAYEGRVSITQYKHEPDDSPLLIARHYAGQLRDQGFELVTICDLPCKSPDGAEDASVYWFHELDVAKKLSFYAVGDRGMYLLAHRADAVVAVRVGSGMNAYVSTIKTVSAPGLDRGPLLAYVEAQRAPVADAPLPPPPGRPAPSPQAPAAAAAPSPFVKDVPPAELSAFVRKTKGWVVLQLSSYDPNCGFCVRANPTFNTLAEHESPKGWSFVRAVYQPWTSVSNNDFALQYGVSGLPTFFTFQDGQLMRRHQGIADEATLRKALLDGLR